jgi:hypothetical protein
VQALHAKVLAVRKPESSHAGPRRQRWTDHLTQEPGAFGIQSQLLRIQQEILVNSTAPRDILDHDVRRPSSPDELLQEHDFIL